MSEETTKNESTFAHDLGKTVAINTAASAGAMVGIFLGVAIVGSAVEFINRKKNKKNDNTEE